MNKEERKQKKRRERIIADLESFGFDFPEGLRENIEDNIAGEEGEYRLNPIQLTMELLNIAPQYKKTALISLICSIIAEVFVFTTFFFGALVAQGIYQYHQYGEGTEVKKYAIITAVALLLHLIVSGISTYLSHRTSFEILHELRMRLFKKLQEISPGYLVEQPVGKIKVLLNERVSELEDWIAHLMPELPGKLLHPILCTIILFSVDWPIGLSIFAPLPIVIGGSMIMMKKYEARLGVYIGAYGHLAEKTVEFVRGIPVIKAFLYGDRYFKKYKEAVDFAHDTTMEWYKTSWLSMAIILGAVMSPFIATLPIAFLRFQNGKIEIWGLLLSLVLPLSILPQGYLLAQSMELFQLCSDSYRGIHELLQIKPQIRPEYGTNPDFDRSKGVVLKKVRFSYVQDQEVLHGISFEAKPNEITALVGPSGSGKSTVAKLIAGFWDQDEGQIFIENVSNKDLAFEELMEELAYVSQDNFLFDTSIKKNLLLAKPDATEEEIIKACQLASCHDFIMDLPDGYETIVGDAGGRLSGGERQRITIARAMLKDARIIVLDEATAYTDPENEALIQDAISRLIKNKTLIVIAHRLHTIQNAHQILVMEKGNIVARGVHEDLMESSNIYQNLWKRYLGEEEYV
ncbi:MAG: ABC transporter ATP-binding protein [Tissierellia bacterium]|nr:ABC transporter ATP-binding protein [Tissierellia bacterium]